MNLCKERGNRASEKEYLIAETIHACRNNLKEYGEAFSFDAVTNMSPQNGGIIDNGTAYNYLFNDGYFTHGKFKERNTIIPTEKLLDELEEFLK